MTIIAILLFMVPFLGFCAFILALGISDFFGRKGRERAGKVTITQAHDNDAP